MNEQRSLLQALALYGQLGLSIAIPLGLCTFLGHLADQKLGTGSLLLLVGLVVGGIVAFYTMYRMLKDATS